MLSLTASLVQQMFASVGCCPSLLQLIVLSQKGPSDVDDADPVPSSSVVVAPSSSVVRAASHSFFGLANVCSFAAVSHVAWMTVRPFASMVRLGQSFEQSRAWGKQCRDNDSVRSPQA